MSYIPDCREDEAYNQKYLNQRNKDFVAGYDYAVERILELIKDNNNVYPDLNVLLNKNIAVINEDKVEMVTSAIEHWSEMQRNELITSMIDDMDEDEYESIKEQVDGREGHSERMDG